MIENLNIQFTVHDEATLTWQQHNEVHRALNIAYGYRTQNFINKSYGYCLPVKRIICMDTNNNVLIGHIAIFETIVSLKNKPITVAGLGLTLSLRPFLLLGNQLRKRALELCATLGYPLAISRIKNKPRTKQKLEELATVFFDYPLIGTSTRSHDWETIAVYVLNGEENLIVDLKQECHENKFLKIASEVF